MRSRLAETDHAEWNHAVRGETELQSVDRHFNELLQELRVAQTGVQILFAFLLGLAFTPRFPELTGTEHGVYLVTLVLSAVPVRGCRPGPAAAGVGRRGAACGELRAGGMGVAPGRGPGRAVRDVVVRRPSGPPRPEPAPANPVAVQGSGAPTHSWSARAKSSFWVARISRTNGLAHCCQHVVAAS